MRNHIAKCVNADPEDILIFSNKDGSFYDWSWKPEGFPDPCKFVAHTNPNCLDSRYCYSHGATQEVRMKLQYHRNMGKFVESAYKE